MPGFETMDRYQTAVLWEKAGDDDYGEPTWGSPEEIQVRWVDHRQELRNPNDTNQGYDVTVIAGQHLEVGSLLYLGTLAEWIGTGSGDVTAERLQIIKRDKTPDIKNRHTRWRYALMRFRGTSGD